MTRFFLILFVFFAVLVSGRADDEFKFSWEEEGADEAPAKRAAEPAAESAVEGDKPKAAAVEDAEGDEEFGGWSFDENAEAIEDEPDLTEPVRSTGEAPAPVPVRAAPPAADARPNPADADKYNRLVRENLELRKNMDTLKTDLARVQSENANLKVSMDAVETKRRNMAAMLSDLKGEQNTTQEHADKIAELERKLDGVETEKKLLLGDKQRLDTELAALRQRQAAPLPAPRVAVDSDFVVKLKRDAMELKHAKEELERENQQLESRVDRVERVMREDSGTRENLARRERDLSTELARVKAQSDALRRQIKDDQQTHARDKRAFGRYVKSSAGLETELEKTKRELRAKDSVLDKNKHELTILAEELRKRDWRHSRAVGVADRLEGASAEVGSVVDLEKLDMHYNMGIMLAERGLYSQARREYMRALRIDPSDADVHYNLGILYDDHLDKSSRALTHYRKYMTLRPTALDIDQIRGWVFEIETRIR